MAAIVFTTLRNTNQETIIKFTGAAGDTGAITIANLAASTQVRNAATPTVNMVRFMATGLNASAVTVNRNSVLFFNAAPAAAVDFDLTQNGITDSQNNTSPTIDFTIAGAPVTGYITLRKLAGWDTTVETATYGAYDNTTVVGS
jgi:hypothetical protein